MSEALPGIIRDDVVRAGIPFGAGVGVSRQELCGALSGGLLVIGLRHGRADVGADNTPGRAVAARLRNRFLETFGHARCHELLAIAGWEQQNCRELAGEAAVLLLDVLREAPSVMAGK